MKAFIVILLSLLVVKIAHVSRTESDTRSGARNRPVGVVPASPRVPKETYIETSRKRGRK